MSESHEQNFGFTDVDRQDDADRLLVGMDATATWPAVQELHEWSEPLLQPGALLDVGCGQGYALLALARAAGTGRFVGVDVSTMMLDAARTRASKAGLDVTFKEASATDLPFDDHEFDSIRCERVLQWLPDPQLAVDEMVRVVRPGGRIVLLDTDWRTYGSTADQELEAEMFSAPTVWPSPHAGGFLRNYLLTAGVSDVEVKAVVHHATTWAEDSSDGLLPADGLREFKIASGMPAARVDRYIGELRRQSDAGTMSMVLTMWGATGTASSGQA
jgi:ubiquinone/menaquinone biosynthesis C-methylase UbiE